jgi:hypothetical protein
MRIPSSLFFAPIRSEEAVAWEELSIQWFSATSWPPSTLLHKVIIDGVVALPLLTLMIQEMWLRQIFGVTGKPGKSLTGQILVLAHRLPMLG